MLEYPMWKNDDVFIKEELRDTKQISSSSLLYEMVVPKRLIYKSTALQLEEKQLPTLAKVYIILNIGYSIFILPHRTL